MTIKTVRIPLVGSLINRNQNPNSFNTKDQLFENCYPEVVNNAVTGKAKVYLNKRPGTAASAALSSTGVASFGACVWSSVSSAPGPIAVLSFTNTGSTSTSVWNINGTQIGGAIPTTIQCHELTDTSINGVGNLVGIFADSATNALEAWYFPEGGAWTQITSNAFPPNLGTPEALTGAPVHLNGRMYVMTTNGKVWNSDLNSVSTWTASAFNTAQSYPDGGCGLARYRDLIVAFGKYSIEFFQDVGLTPSPIISVGTAVNRVGCVKGSSQSNRTVLQVSNTVYFIGHSAESGSQGIYRLNGFSAEHVSNPYIDKLLNSGIIDKIVGSCTLHGLSYIVVSSSSTNWAFCEETKTWWTFSTGANVRISAIVGNLGNSYYPHGTQIQNILASSPVYQDATSTYTQIVQLESMDMGTQNRKIWKRFKVVGDIQQSTSALLVKYSDDDYGNYTTAGTIDMNVQYQIENGLTRLGSSRRRSWKLEHSANTPNRLEAIEIEYEVGPS